MNEMEIRGDRDNITWTELLGSVGTSHLPGDLMIEILGRLPVESIIRSKSVCRAWYALFMSPIFIQHHCRIAGSSAAMDNLLSLIVHTRGCEGNDQILSLLLNQSDNNSILTNLHTPFECHMDEIQVVGSINGLVCVSLCNAATSIVLWNPAIREHYQIPIPTLLMENEERVSLGLAYDEKTKEQREEEGNNQRWMAGLRFQYKFFPTDFFVPTFEPDPCSKAASAPQIVSVRSRKLSENLPENRFPVDVKLALSSSSLPAVSIEAVIVEKKTQGGDSDL